MNIPGRMSMAKNQLVFKSMLPPLGFNTYYFQIKSLFSFSKSFILLFFFTAIKETKPKVKVTHNEICTLENEVRNRCRDKDNFTFSIVCSSRIR
jgi:hypothetical protein